MYENHNDNHGWWYLLSSERQAVENLFGKVIKLILMEAFSGMSRWVARVTSAQLSSAISVHIFYGNDAVWKLLNIQ